MLEQQARLYSCRAGYLAGQQLLSQVVRSTHTGPGLVRRLAKCTPSRRYSEPLMRQATLRQGTCLPAYNPPPGLLGELSPGGQGTPHLAADIVRARLLSLLLAQLQEGQPGLQTAGVYQATRIMHCCQQRLRWQKEHRVDS